MDKLTVLMLEHPRLSDLDKGEMETHMQWFGRCYESVRGGRAMALRHKEGDNPYLKLYGTVDAFTFTPHAPLRFPVERGFIAELVALFKDGGSRADEYEDARVLFEAAPASADTAFRRILAVVKEKTRVACPPSAPTYGLDSLAETLADLYGPGRGQAAGNGAAEAAPSSRRALDTLQRRLGRATLAQAKSDKRVMELEKENAKLLAIIAEKDIIIAAQAADIVAWKSRCRQLQGELDGATRAVRSLEQRPTQEKLTQVMAQLSDERKALRAAQRKIALMTKEQTKLRRKLTCAEKGFDEAERACQAAVEEAKGVKSAAAKAAVRAATVERDAAAQVALAQAEGVRVDGCGAGCGCRG